MKISNTIILILIIGGLLSCDKDENIEGRCKTIDISSKSTTSATGGGVISFSKSKSVISVQIKETGVLCAINENYLELDSNGNCQYDAKKFESSDKEIGTFICYLTNLQPSTTYYIRAFTILESVYKHRNEKVVYKNVVYGDLRSFTTFEDPPKFDYPPPITTPPCPPCVTLNWNIFHAGMPTYFERGVVYATTPTPIITYNNKKVISGTGTGYFSTEICDLKFNTTYYVRAYALNGGEPVYSEQVSFTTCELPSLTTNIPSNVTPNAATLGGNIIYVGNPAYTERGVVYAANTLDLTKENIYKKISGTGIGDFSTEVFGLVPNTTYYVRSYAINGPKPAYGEMVSFTTEISGIWTKKEDFAGGIRVGAVGFSINNKGYVGTGEDRETGFKKDFWEYDPDLNIWTQKADFKGGARIDAVGFSIGNKGYIGTGWDGNNFKKDFWEYDPILNTWTEKTDFAGEVRSSAVGFSIGIKGYIGTGWNGNEYQDFWEYDPDENKWTQRLNFPGESRRLAVGFSIEDKGYVGTGGNNNNDFWEYNPVRNIWTRKENIPNGGTASAIGFSIGSKGYIGTGYPWGRRDFWEYDPISDTWIQKGDFAGGGREAAVCFSIGNKGYVGTGFTYDEGGPLKHDFWEFTP